MPAFSKINTKIYLLICTILSFLSCLGGSARCHAFERQVSHRFIKSRFIPNNRKPFSLSSNCSYNKTFLRRCNLCNKLAMSSSSSANKMDDKDVSKGIFVDIGANLLDPMYTGNYRDKQRHDPDLSLVLQRAWDNKLDKIIITGGTLEESKKGIELARTYNHTATSTATTTASLSSPRLFATVGVHPTRCRSEFGEDDTSWENYLNEMRQVIIDGTKDGTVVAMGELGLDYARLEFCDVESQKKGFIAQLEIARELDLPLFLHNRETGFDLLSILKEHYFTDDGQSRAGGVVHSFDDSIELATAFMDLGLYIGINGCSLKTEQNLQVVREIPLEKLLLETGASMIAESIISFRQFNPNRNDILLLDCPWCDIRATHAGFEHVKTKFTTKTEKKYEVGCCVKGRYEPCHIVQVAEVVAGIKNISVEEVATATRNNAHTVFRGLTKNY